MLFVLGTVGRRSAQQNSEVGNTMAMTRKDYKAIAEVIKECKSDFRSGAHYRQFIEDLMMALAANNRNFDTVKFEEAVGIADEE